MIRILTLISVITCLTFAENRDSAEYVITYERIIGTAEYPPEYEAYLDAAKELALKGMYDVANDILVDMFSKVLGFDEEITVDNEEELILFEEPAKQEKKTQDVKKKKQKKVRLRANASVSYEKYDYSSILSDTADSIKDSIDEIDNQPLNGNAKVMLDVKPETDALELFSTNLYASNTRIRIGADAAGSPAKRFIKYNIETEAEKRLFEDYEDSSDAVRISSELTATTRSLEKPVSVSLPLKIEAEKYRIERIQYPSYAEISGGPEIGFANKDMTKNITLCLNGEYRRYSKINSSDNGYGYGPVLKNDILTQNVFGFSELYAKWECFNNRNDTWRSNEAGLDMSLSIRSFKAVSINIDGTGLWQKEYHRNQNLFFLVDTADISKSETTDNAAYYTVASYNLMGYGAILRPSMSIEAGNGFSIPVEFAVEWYRYPVKTEFDGKKLLDTLSLSQSYQAVQPSIGLGYERKELTISISIGYRIEDVKYNSGSEDCNTLMPSIEVSHKFNRVLSMDGSSDFRYRMYKGGENETDISVYIGASAQF
jgi:hypothetical protein